MCVHDTTDLDVVEMVFVQAVYVSDESQPVLQHAEVLLRGRRAHCTAVVVSCRALHVREVAHTRAYY